MTPKAVTFFGYWSGLLPEVTELHFRSFLHYHPHNDYDLWLDIDTASNFPAKMDWLAHHPQIHLRYFSLQALIDRYVINTPLPDNNPDTALKNFIRAQHKRKILRWINLRSKMHPAIGVTYQHSSPLFRGFLHNLAYRGDLARCLIPLEHYQGSSLYVDLDICFLSNLLDLCQDRAFAYRWENHTFANNAVLYTPNQTHSQKVIKKGNVLETFVPWHLFTDDICEELGIDIYPTNLFDALWDDSSLLRNDIDLFFKDSAMSKVIVEDLFKKGYRVNHWHNNWKTVPDTGSPYHLLLQQLG